MQWVATSGYKINREVKAKRPQSYESRSSIIFLNMSHLLNILSHGITMSLSCLRGIFRGLSLLLSGQIPDPKIFRIKKTVGIRIPDNNIVMELVWNWEANHHNINS